MGETGCTVFVDPSCLLPSPLLWNRLCWSAFVCEHLASLACNKFRLTVTTSRCTSGHMYPMKGRLYDGGGASVQWEEHLTVWVGQVGGAPHSVGQDRRGGVSTIRMAHTENICPQNCSRVS